MQVQSINNNASSFGALNLTAEAKVLIERERGGKAAIKRATKELENSRWDLNIKTLGKDAIYPYFGDDRATCVIPSRVQDEFVMVYSSEVGGDNDDDITDCLKFSTPQRAKEVFETLKEHFFKNNKTPLQHFRWDVDAMKAFTEAELVPQTESPWAHFLERKSSTPSVKNEIPIVEPAKSEKPSFAQRIKNAWIALKGN